jgi:hypothetical protein
VSSRLAVAPPTTGPLPRAVTRALILAADVAPAGAIPCAVLVEAGAEPIAALTMRALARLGADEAAR